MTISNFTYEKKREKVRKQFNKSGWKLNQYHEHKNNHHVYFYHMETGKQFLSSVILDNNFPKIRQDAIRHKNNIGEIVNYLCSQDKLTKIQTTELQKCVSLWALATQSFEIMKEKKPLTEFSSLIIFYRGLGDSVYIRPVCFPVEQYYEIFVLVNL